MDIIIILIILISRNVLNLGIRTGHCIIHVTAILCVLQSISNRGHRLDVIEERDSPDLDRELHGEESGRSSSETDERRSRYVVRAMTYTCIKSLSSTTDRPIHLVQ